jgi:hypothetical protein
VIFGVAEPDQIFQVKISPNRSASLVRAGLEVPGKAVKVLIVIYCLKVSKYFFCATRIKLKSVKNSTLPDFYSIFDQIRPSTFSSNREPTVGCCSMEAVSGEGAILA